MLDEKMYKKEIVRMWDTLRGDEYKGKNICDGVLCGDCQLSLFDGCSSAEDIFDIYKTVEKWSKEHPEKHKISKLEYEILKIYSDDYFYYFYESELLMLLLKKGQFKGATSKTNIINYLNNCEVKEDV